MLLKKKKSGEVYDCFLHKEDPSKALTFINITITDASGAVFKMVHEKISSKQAKLPGPAKLKAKVANRIAKTSAANVPPKVIATKLSEKLPKMLMYKMHHNAGMKVAAQAVFIEEGFLVIQVQVQHVDLNKLLASMSSTTDDQGDTDDDDDSVASDVLDEWIDEQQQLLKEEKASPFVATVESSQRKSGGDWKDKLVAFLEWVISRVLPVTVHRSLEEDRLPSLVQSKLADSMQAMVEKKLENKSMVAETEVLSQEDEARYFFPQLQKVRGKEPSTM